MRSLLRSTPVVLIFATALLVLTGACGPSADPVPDAAYVADDGTYHVPVLALDMHFVPDAITVPEGRSLVIELTNEDGMPHDLVIDGGPGSALLGRGESAVLHVGVVTGARDGWCAVTGHRAQGMILTITGR